MNNIKKERLASELQRQISFVLMSEIKDDDINFVTVTYVRLNNDVSEAKVYYTVLNEDKKEETNKALQGASGFIRTKLCELVDIRHMPRLEFIYDESIEYGNKIENIIKEINKDSE